MEQFDQALGKFSQWSETMLSNLHSSSEINISNLQPAAAQAKVRFITVYLRVHILSRRKVSCLQTMHLIPYHLPFKGDTGSITEAVQCETELGTTD